MSKFKRHRIAEGDTLNSTFFRLAEARLTQPSSPTSPEQLVKVEALAMDAFGAYVGPDQNSHAPRALLEAQARRAKRVAEALFDSGVYHMDSERTLESSVPTFNAPLYAGQPALERTVQLDASNHPIGSWVAANAALRAEGTY